MVITIDPALEAALTKAAKERGITPEVLALNALQDRFLEVRRSAIEPRDEWEKRLFEAARDCGTWLTDEQLSSEGLYD